MTTSTTINNFQDAFAQMSQFLLCRPVDFTDPVCISKEKTVLPKKYYAETRKLFGKAKPLKESVECKGSIYISDLTSKEKNQLAIGL